ncbi:helix-turn-helix domain-containing protein [Aquabacterium sp.]|uniref:helix-turn-helix domain-containing protein n=1 Tax=Aquabacterium sp. TaxID=1872578 RepID=UPI00378415D5
MTEPAVSPREPAGNAAGELLRAARQKQGLHIAALAASIKVAPAKLEALEAGRYDELPDATFTRALAQSVCRVLKIDAQPVLSQLPSSRAAALEKVDAGLNTPFRERPGRSSDPVESVLLRHPMLWLAALLLAGAAAFVLVPGHWVQRWLPAGTPADESAAPTAPAPAMPPAARPASVVETVTQAVVEAASAVVSASAASAPAAAAVAPAAQASGPAPLASAATAAPASATRIQAAQATWVQATDARGQVLVNRTLQAGETVDLEGARPLRLRIGNVKGTVLLHRGQTVDLSARAQNNVANVELP